MRELKIFSGRANPGLSARICEFLHLPRGLVALSDFPDGEIACKIEEDVRGRDVFLIQPTCPPVNTNLMELLVMIDSCVRASASRITAVMPYYGYARQDRKDEGRVPITAKLVANLITRAGADRVLTMDLHAAQIQGFFDVPVDHFTAIDILDDHLRNDDLSDRVIASPDVGRATEARRLAVQIDQQVPLHDPVLIVGHLVKDTPRLGEVLAVRRDLDGQIDRQPDPRAHVLQQAGAGPAGIPGGRRPRDRELALQMRLATATPTSAMLRMTSTVNAATTAIVAAPLVGRVDTSLDLLLAEGAVAVVETRPQRHLDGVPDECQERRPPHAAPTATEPRPRCGGPSG